MSLPDVRISNQPGSSIALADLYPRLLNEWLRPPPTSIGEVATTQNHSLRDNEADELVDQDRLKQLQNRFESIVFTALQTDEVEIGNLLNVLLHRGEFQESSSTIAGRYATLQRGDSRRPGSIQPIYTSPGTARRQADHLRAGADLMALPDGKNDVAISRTVGDALEQLARAQPEVEAGRLDSERRWVVRLCSEKMFGVFGGLRVVEKGFSPVGVMVLLRVKRVTWQAAVREDGCSGGLGGALGWLFGATAGTRLEFLGGDGVLGYGCDGSEVVYGGSEYMR